MMPAEQLNERKAYCSVYTLTVEKGKKAYRYDVDVWRLPMPRRNGEMDAGKNLVKSADDGQRALYRNLCFELMTVVFSKTNRLGMPNGNELVYDCRAIMFTSCPLKAFDVPDGLEIIIENGDVNNYIRTYCGHGNDVRFSVRIKRNSAVPELDLNDFSQYQSGDSVFDEDRSLRTFFELAISQCAINNELFVPIGVGKLYENPNPQQNPSNRIGNGMILREGLTKGVKVIKNDRINGNGRNGPRAAVVLDTKVSAFFEPQNLVQAVLKIIGGNGNARQANFSRNDLTRAHRLLEDVRVEVDYRKTRTFELGSFTETPIRDLTLDIDLPNGGGREVISVAEYFLRQYNIQLQYTNLPGVHPNDPRQPGRTPEIYPLEVLNIMEDQRVPQSKTTPALMDILLKASSLPPSDRMDKISTRARQLCLFHDENPVLRAFGITVDQKSNEIVVGVRNLPRLRFRNREIGADPAQGDWRREGSKLPYLETKKLNNWIVLCEEHNIDVVERFVRLLLDLGRTKGLNINDPNIVDFSCSERNHNDWRETFETSVNEKIDFVMLIDPKPKDTHGLLKLYEVMYQPIVTQHVTLEKVRDIVQRHQRQTLENILNKVNMKNFGLNYQPVIEQCGRRFALETGDVLVIGYDVSHPPPMSGLNKRRLAAAGESELSSLEPSVVGICANMAKNPHAFVGDYFYQESRRESLDMVQLADRMAWILLNLEKSRPQKCRPKYIFIFRDGLSEGQFAMASREELEAIRIGCSQHDPKYKPQFFLLIGTKRHFKRFFIDGGFGEGGRPLTQNLPPGSVIDRKIVRADLTEFYIHPHYPIKGSGKALEVAILANEPEATLDEVQALMMSLSFSHQIVNLPISVPEPIYQADELAKRGKNNFAAFRKFYPNSVPERELDLPQREGARQQRINVVDFRRLTEFLAYWGNGTEILSHRFTA